MACEIFTVPVRSRPNSYARFVADFESDSLTVSLPYEGSFRQVKLPLSPERWKRQDRIQWQNMRQLLPPDFNLVANLREAILSPI